MHGQKNIKLPLLCLTTSYHFLYIVINTQRGCHTLKNSVITTINFIDNLSLYATIKTHFGAET